MLQQFINWIKPMPDAENKVEPEKIDSVYKMWRLRMFLGMYFGYVIFYFVRKNEPFVRSVMGQAMGLSLMELGILGSVIYITYGIGKFLCGTLADRANIRAVMALGLLGSSIINLFFPYLPSLWLLAFFWGLNGVFQAMGFPPIAKGLVHWYAPKERATMWTLWSSSHMLGTFLIGLIVAYILKIGAWQAAFYIPGIIGIISSFFILKTLTDKPSAVGLPPIEVYKNDTMPIKSENNLSHKEILKKYVLKNQFLWYLAIAYIFVYYIRFATLDWGTKFLCDERGFEPAMAASWMVWMPLFGMFGGIVAGLIADKFFKGRCTPINVAYLILLGISSWGFYVYASPQNPFMTMLCLSAIGFLVDGPQNMIGGVQASRVVVQEAAAASTGFTGMFGYLGATLSGVGAAAIIGHWGWQGFYLSCFIASLLSVLLVSATWAKESSADTEESAAEIKS